MRHQFVAGRVYIYRGFIAAFAAALLIVGWVITNEEHGHAQSMLSSMPTPTSFRIGEKLSYNITFSKIANAGYFETHVVSRGRIGGRDAVELRSKIKTLELVSAAFFMIDESRTVYAAPDTGLPLHISINRNDSVLPKAAVSNFLTQPTTNFDLLTLIYKARESGGIGTFTVLENEQFYTMTFVTGKAERVRTDAGEFDTTVSFVESGLLTAYGIRELKINFSTDEHRVPVRIRFKTAKGEFRLLLSAISLPEEPVSSPTPAPTPLPTAAPKPPPAPDIYIENRPLAPELGFALGESLAYRITTGGKPVGVITLNARERKLFQKEDSLLLTATITSVEQGSNDFRLGDSALAHVDPETLAPQSTKTGFASALIGLNQTVTFDAKTGLITFGGAQTVEAPIGTHSIVSLIYAMRSFNLKPSKDPTNPINDTRVAVFWESKANVFTLRPSNPEAIIVNGEKVSAQLITINTGNPQLDALALKVWLSPEGRVPLRFSAGVYQAELVSQTTNLPKAPPIVKPIVVAN